VNDGSAESSATLCQSYAERDSRLALCYATATVLKEALRLLGVEAPDEM